MIRTAAALGLILFTFFISVVAAEAMDIIQAGTEASPDDPPPSAVARYGAAHPGEAVHVAGSLSVLAIGGSGLVALIVWPERSGYAYQVLAAMIGVLVTLPVVGNPDNYGGQAGWIDPVFMVVVMPSIVASLVALPWGDWRSGDARPAYFVLAAIAAVPGAWYGINQALNQRNTFPPTADPHHNAHWWVMAAVAFVVVLVVAAAALPGRGWRLGAVVAGASAFAVGAASLLAQSAASAAWTGWAIAAMVWGIVAVWLALRSQEGESPA